MGQAAVKLVRRELLQQNRGLRAWRRRPLVWCAWVFVLGALLTGSLIADSYDEVWTQRNGDPVPATVLSSWDGGSSVPVRYRNPSTGHVRELVVAEDFDTVHRVGPVRLRITPDHEDEGRPPGSKASAHVVDDARIMFDGEADRTTWISGAIWTAALLAVLGAWAWRRRRRVGRGAELFAAASTRSKSMIAVPCRGLVLPRRWTVALFDASSGPEAPSIGRLRVAPHGGAPGPRPVEVLGDLGRWRSCVLLEPASGQRWVPLGRPLRQHLPRPSAGVMRVDGWRPTGLSFIVIGVALLITGAARSADPIGDLAGRSEPVTVQLQRSVPSGGAMVRVSYRFGGERRTSFVHLGGPQREGARARLRVDRTRPSVLWQDGTDSPPVTGDNRTADLLQAAGSLVAIGGLFLLRRSRTPREAAMAVAVAVAAIGATSRPGWVPPPPAHAPPAWSSPAPVLPPAPGWQAAAPPPPAPPAPPPPVRPAYEVPMVPEPGSDPPPRDTQPNPRPLPGTLRLLGPSTPPADVAPEDPDPAEGP